MALSTFPDFAHYQFKMAAIDTENEKTIEQIELSAQFHGNRHISDSAGLAYDTADMARRLLISRIQEGGHHFQFRSPPS